MTNRLNTYFFVPKGLKMNNPVRSAGENILLTMAAPKGLNPKMIIFSSFGAVIELVTYPEYSGLFKFNPFGALCIKTDTHILITVGANLRLR